MTKRVGKREIKREIYKENRKRQYPLAFPLQLLAAGGSLGLVSAGDCLYENIYVVRGLSDVTLGRTRITVCFETGDLDCNFTNP